MELKQADSAQPASDPSRDEMIAEAARARLAAEKCRLASRDLLDSMLVETLRSRAEELDAMAGMLERRARRMPAA